MPIPVIFDPAAFKVRYPEFVGCGDGQIQGYFNESTIYCRNDGTNPILDASVLGTLLNMLTAHVAWLNAPRAPDGSPSSSGQAAPPIVGRISSASEGSVSVQTENMYGPGTVQWYQQTKYGSAYWAASAPWRTARYRPGPRTPINPPFPFRGTPWG